MKKVLLAGLLLGLVYQANAQKSVGAGFAYGTDVSQLGFVLDGEFNVNDQWAVSPDFIIYFVDNGPNVKTSLWEFNANANYYFSTSGVASLYAIGGLNLATASVKIDGGERYSNSELGINLGIGSNFDIDAFLVPFAEFKFTLGSFDQGVLMFGAKFPF